MSASVHSKSIPLSSLVRGEEITRESWSLDRAYKFCERLARSHYENFPVASLLIPKQLRKHFYSIYAFARIADDLADEGYGENNLDDDRIGLLDEWREMLREATAGRAHHPVFIALSRTVSEFNLPVALFEDLLSAFRQDVVVRRYDDFDQLLDYCRRSANPIGRLILLLFGHRDERMNAWSDSICTALQLANHWQDVAVDLDKDRIYLPAEDLADFHLSEGDLRGRKADDRFRRLMKFEVERTREMFAQGKPLCDFLKGRLGLEIRAVWLGGARILERIEENDFDIFSRRPVISAADKLRIFLGALRRS